MAYLSLTDADRERMLAEVGVSSVEELFAPIPGSLRLDGLQLPAGLSEPETRARLNALADLNRPCHSSSFLGAGCYQHSVPAAVSALTGRTEFETAYTPYQAEASQGTLQAIFEFQTAMCELTGLDVANASLYDGPSAAAEGTFMALRLTKRERIVCSAGVHPETLEVLETYASGPDLAVDTLDLDPDTGCTSVSGAALPVDTGAVVVQQPNFFGVIEDVAALAEAARSVGALLVVVQNPLTLALLEAPGRLGADIVVGDVQVFGNPMSFGGPSAGYLACRQAYLRQLPGRLVGQTLDADGRTCYCLTLQAREQHIRRQKATSNICSNQSLNALAAVIYMGLLGPQGLAELAGLCLERAHYLQEGLAALPGITSVFTGLFFNEFVVVVAGGAAAFAAAMRGFGTDPGVPLGRFSRDWEDRLLVAVTELNAPADLDAYLDRARVALEHLDHGNNEGHSCNG